MLLNKDIGFVAAGQSAEIERAAWAAEGQQVMNECSTGEQIAAFVFGFLFFFLIHAAPMAYIFKRWGHRYCLGLLPAAFCALGAASYFSFEISCGLIQSKQMAVFLAAMFYGICYLLLVFFKPDMAAPGVLWGDAIIPVILSTPAIGAIAAVVWLLLSLRRDRLLMVTGEETTLRNKIYETLAHGVMIILFGVYIAYNEIN